MVEEAQDAEIPFEYVLSDTRFSKPVQLLVDLKNVGTDVIAMVAKTSTKYMVEEPDTGRTRDLNLKRIFSRNKKRPGKIRYLRSVKATVS